MLLEQRKMREFLIDALGDGNHLLQVCTPGTPTLVIIEDYGWDDFGDRAFEIHVVDPSSENNLPLESVVDYVKWFIPRPKNNTNYRILPRLSLERYQALKNDIALRGVQVPAIMDQHGNIIDGWHRWLICQELGIHCPTEVRYFESEAERFQLILAVNCPRRQLNTKQKRDLIAIYLKADPVINDNWLAEIIGGVSKNTVADQRRRLQEAGQIARLTTLRGKDGKKRPAKFKKIIANSPKEVERALEAIKDLPDNCSGRTVDLNTAKRRARRNKKKQEREGHIIVPLPDDAIRLYHCRFQELEGVAGIQPASVNLICTDFPYVKEFLPQLADLAQFAQRVLVEGGLFVTYTGKYFFNKVFRIFDDHLTYRWMSCAPWVREGTLIASLNVQNHWKPVLIFSKGGWQKRDSWSDLLRGPKEKNWHEWQQSLQEVEKLIRDFSKPGDLVIDPCGGGFTTAAACFRLARRCISCDVDAECVSKGLERLAGDLGSVPTTA